MPDDPRPFDRLPSEQPDGSVRIPIGYTWRDNVQYTAYVLLTQDDAQDALTAEAYYLMLDSQGDAEPHVAVAVEAHPDMSHLSDEAMRLWRLLRVYVEQRREHHNAAN